MPRNLVSHRQRPFGFLTLAVVATLLGGATSLLAQTSGSADNGVLSRQQLEAQAAAAEREATSASDSKVRDQRRTEAAAIRERLRDGDFQVGDRIVVTVQGETFLTDTFVVRAGRTVTFPNLPDISLQGVLRAELTDHLTREIGKYVRSPTVRATPLVRVAVLGEVNNPGFYSVPADFLASDVIMAAGGPSRNADVSKTQLKRGKTVMLDRQQFQRAVADGSTLDRLDVRPGDEVVVGERTRRNWWAIAQVTGAVLGIIGTIIALAN